MENVLTPEIEKTLVKNFKLLLDPNPSHNFARPLSEFWDGATPEMTSTYGHYGIWFSGEGGTLMKDGDYAAYYYEKTLAQGHPLLQKFMDENNLKLRWHDPGTPILIDKDDEL